MFDMNPLNLPDAQLQLWIMLIVAGVLGFIIGYVSRHTTIRQLEIDLAGREREVEDCYRKPTVSVAQGDDEETTVLNRIRARAGEINFNRIGLASASNADDLKVIAGIGPFLEKKLHAVGIYTFQQIANFNSEDIEQINDLIEFFPGRIVRDNWVGQAAELVKKT
jgi:predicted flap endonuclease-1-like 5' DNA nuclease